MGEVGRESEISSYPGSILSVERKCILFYFEEVLCQDVNFLLCIMKLELTLS